MTKKRGPESTLNCSQPAKKIKTDVQQIIDSIESNRFEVLAPYFSNVNEATLLDTYVDDTFLDEYIKKLVNLKFSKNTQEHDNQLWYAAAFLFPFSQQQLKTKLKTVQDYLVILKLIQFADRQDQTWIKTLCKEKLMPLTNQFMVEIEDDFMDQTQLSQALIGKIDWYITHCPSLFPIVKNQEYYLKIVKKLFQIYPTGNKKNQQKILHIVNKHSLFFSPLIEKSLPPPQEESALDEYKDLFEPFLTGIEELVVELPNINLNLDLLHIYLKISPKLYPVDIFSADYIQIYKNLCLLYSQTNNPDIISFIQQHQSFFKEVTNQFMYSHMPLSKARESAAGFTTPLLESISSSADSSVKSTVFFPLMDFAKALQTPSHYCWKDKKEQMCGDAYHRIVWLLAVAVHKQAQLITAKVTKKDCDNAIKLLKQTYGTDWLFRQKLIQQFSQQLTLPFAWSEDTFSNEATLPALISATAAVNKAADQAIEHKQNGFCVIRPPGHHHHHAPAGFCHANYVAAKAISLAKQGKKILIFDCDAHYGDGTHRLILDVINKTPALRNNIRFVNTFVKTGYPFPDASGYGGANCIFSNAISGYSDVFTDIPYDAKSAAPIQTIWTELQNIYQGFTPDLTLVSLGIDAHQLDHVAGGQWITENYNTLFSMFTGPVTAVLEGGYQKAALQAVSTSVIDILCQNQSSQLDENKIASP